MLAILDGYSFCADDRNKTTTHWVCTNTGLCRARFITTKGREFIIKMPTSQHTHERPEFFIKNGVFYRKIVQIFRRPNSGNKVAVVEGYSFYRANKFQHSIIWRCSASSHCLARFTCSNDGYLCILKSNLVHNHPKPQFHIQDGVLYRFK
ncbi:unnamed protein product [Leptosia nina]|uniref:FLYWCH-type domain-containing protein n=1 Tax=Leptosia nina TaxID=320188 RepID=A0AAV1J3C2_9NEOP